MSVANQETVRLEKSESARRGRWRVVLVTDTGSSSFALPVSGTATIGRAENAEIRLEDTAASRKHAQLIVENGAVRLLDLGSANGTTVRGRKLAPNEEIALSEGDSIELGTSFAVLQVDELSVTSRPWNLHHHQRFLELAAQTKPPYAILRVQVIAPPGLAQEVLSAELSPHETVASFGPGQFEVLSPGRTPEAAKQLMEKLSSKLVARGARVRAGVATAPRDGTDPDLLVAACSRPASAPAPGFVVRDDAMAALYRLVDRVAPSAISVLLLGETGVGKEVLAQEIHRRSKRAGGPFLRLNCAALTESLLESELFGHEKGSFTGAIKQKEGLLESAQGGTVFLDEVGEMPASIQAKLLRVLEERKVMRVGSTTPLPIDVRFLFATNRDLEAEVARGAFRSDLYFRVNGISLVIPPLRERPTEIEPLARQFLSEAAKRETRAVPELTPDALATLGAWPWPGNIRELKNVIDRAILMAGEGKLTAEALGLGEVVPASPVAPTAAPTGLREERDAAEKRAVLEALEKTGGNQTKAAELLGVSRRTLVTRLQQYGLTRSRKKD
ncbi:MAG: sigma 54-interacting transcriptional regulator [Archangium sp.]|nr:sigma 54-interacting transcriptional regulator [Archangium sp.]